MNGKRPFHIWIMKMANTSSFHSLSCFNNVLVLLMLTPVLKYCEITLIISRKLPIVWQHDFFAFMQSRIARYIISRCVKPFHILPSLFTVDLVGDQGFSQVGGNRVGQRNYLWVLPVSYMFLTEWHYFCIFKRILQVVIQRPKLHKECRMTSCSFIWVHARVSKSHECYSYEWFWYTAFQDKNSHVTK